MQTQTWFCLRAMERQGDCAEATIAAASESAAVVAVVVVCCWRRAAAVEIVRRSCYCSAGGLVALLEAVFLRAQEQARPRAREMLKQNKRPDRLVDWPASQPVVRRKRATSGYNKERQSAAVCELWLAELTRGGRTTATASGSFLPVCWPSDSLQLQVARAKICSSNCLESTTTRASVEKKSALGRNTQTDRQTDRQTDGRPNSHLHLGGSRPVG